VLIWTIGGVGVVDVVVLVVEGVDIVVLVGDGVDVVLV